MPSEGIECINEPFSYRLEMAILIRHLRIAYLQNNKILD